MTTFAVHLCILLGLVSYSSADDAYLVKDGRAEAEIIIAVRPTRTQRLAAKELQAYLEKISGARLAITDTPGDKAVQIYVGQSEFAEKLGVTAAGLTDGAYRIVSGDRWLALIGDDTNFTPIEPWPRGNNDIRSGKMQKAWDQITGKQWGYMHNQLHKHYSGPNALFGTPQEKTVDENGNVHVWTYDERGSFNAVCGLLRDMGVRWYMPGDIGEITPRAETIPLRVIDRTVRPDFPMRILNFRTAVYGRDVMMWGFRLGVRQPYGRQAAHGLHGMTDNEATLKEHPDWFALYGGKRHNHPNIKNNQLCYSNEQLFAEAVEFARAQLDHFDMDVVSIMPPDGYTAICQCEKCEGKASPELGARGLLSNYVWDFVNRVAKEVAKTHPNKRISNCAYGVYTEPPSNIDKLEPNVQVIIVGGRRPTSADRADLRRLRNAWAGKTDNRLEIFENYPFTGRGFYLPAYMPKTLGESINETKGLSRGEDIWITMDFGEDAVGYNHFLLYFTARMYWGGRQQDASQLFAEYVTKFYGPVAPEMRQFFDYCEVSWRDMERDSAKANRALQLFARAKAKIKAATAEDAESGVNNRVYAARVQLIDNYLNSLRNKAKQLAQKRGVVPKLRLVSGADRRGSIKLDGKLDDELWANIPVASTGRLAELQTGRQPVYGTQFMAEWIGNNLYLGIQCQEAPGTPLNIATKANEDQAIWYGDVVEILLATNAHDYYQLAINPAGALVDFDRGAPRNRWANWSSKAEVATHIGKDSWTAEIRIPITQDGNDPLHQVIGRKPTKSLPWHINICRQRIRDNGSEYSAFSPTAQRGFHVPLKFAHFYAGNSSAFDADPTVTDYVLRRREAITLMRKRQWKAAIKALLAMAEEATELQQSDALREAVVCCINLKDFAQAESLGSRIPIEAAAKSAQMEVLAAQRKWDELLGKYRDEDWDTWPFAQVGKAAFARAKSHHALKNGRLADDDFRMALSHEPDTRIKISIRMLMAENRESNLDDEEGALQLYQQNLLGKRQIGGADEFRSVAKSAAILAKQGKHEAALKVFDAVDIERLQGYWRYEMLLAKADTLTAAGRVGEAEPMYRQVANGADSSDSQRRRATAKQHR